MTGTGAIDNPYIVSTWDEFITAIGESGKYSQFPLVLRPTEDTVVQRGKLYYDAQEHLIEHPVSSGLSSYYENGFEIDLNNVCPEGAPNAGTSPSAAVQICGKFDGRGGTIRNLYSLSNDNCFNFVSSADWEPEIANTDILNIYYIGTGTSISNGSALINTPSAASAAYLKRTRMSGVMYNSIFYKYTNGGGGVIFERCVASLHGISPLLPMFDGEDLSTAGYILKNSHIEMIGTFSKFSSGYWISATNSKISGTLNIGASPWPVFDYFDASVFDVNCTTTMSIQFNHVSVPSVLNTTKAPNVSIVGNAQSRVIQATTAQLANAGWLLDQGFPVGRLS